MAAATPAERPREAGGKSPTNAAGLPFGLILGLASGLAILFTTRGQLRDIDLFWHLIAGRELASGRRPGNLGIDWSFAPDSHSWTSTQWLSELVLYDLHTLGGWTALAALRVGTAATAIGMLAWTTLRGRSPAVAGLPYVVSVGAVAYASQERPQQVTLIGAAALGGVLVEGLATGRPPRWWIVLPLTTLWANLHGGWVLVPATLTLVTIGRLLDHGRRDPSVGRFAGLTASSFLAGLVTPAGAGGATAFLRFSQAATIIREWQPTEPWSVFGILTVLMLALFAVGWARSTKVPFSEVIAVLALLTFTWMAWRNVAPGLAILAPLAAHRLCSAFSTSTRPEPRWSGPVGVGLAVSLSIAGVGAAMGRGHLPLASQPIGLAARISELPPNQRVLNDYNVAGVVLYFGGNGTRVAIDGRTDRYGSRYIEDYVGMTKDLSGDWEALLDDLNPTLAILKSESPLTHVLIQERGWASIAQEGAWSLLAPSTGAATNAE